MEYRKTVVVEGHEVTLEVDDSYVSLLVNGDDERIEADPLTKIKVALAARRLWQEALYEIPFGIYLCWPTSEDRRRVYMAAGWRPCHQRRGHLMFRLLSRSSARRAAK
jgi:hypothetical protein